MASVPVRIPGLIRFGDDFEFDLEAYRLRRSGRVLKLERIPTEVLGILLEHRGQLVSREQIVERIWGKGTFLDTDNSINGAIRKVRHVLRDDPEQPRFIQTVTGRGYRFIAPVTDAAVARPFAVPSPRPTVIEPPTAGPTPRRWPIALGVSMVLIAALGAYFQWYRSSVRPSTQDGRLMLAVLPFENLTGDSAQDYFSDGMTEEMITQLGSVDPQRLGVIARTSVMHYKHSPESLQQIGRELGVQYVLEGSIRRDSGRVRITAQLIQMKDQTHLWARQFDRDLSTLLAIEGEIATETADEIQIALGYHAPITAAKRSNLSPQTSEAHDLYLKGQYFLNKRTVGGFQRAIDYFQQAVTKDPNYARAYAGLADSYALLGPYSAAPPLSSCPKRAPRRSGLSR